LRSLASVDAARILGKAIIIGDKQDAQMQGASPNRGPTRLQAIE